MGFGNEVAKVLSMMQREKKLYKDYLPMEAVDLGSEMVKSVESLWEDVRQSICNLLEREMPYNSPYASVWWYSVLLWIGRNSDIVYRFISYIRQYKNAFSKNTQCFLFYQISMQVFTQKELNTGKVKLELWKFYKEIAEEFAEEVQTSLEEIPHQKRNKDLIIVVTEQFLDVRHGPTKTVLDRCKILMEEMGKNVVLIDSCEMVSLEGKIPFYGMQQGGRNKRTDEKVQVWKGTEIPYVRCSNHMPDIEELDQILKKVRSMAPGWVVVIGGGGILGNLLGKMAPSLSIGTVPSELGITCTKYQTLGRKLTQQDIETLTQIGRTKEQVVEGIFTSSLKPQEEHITKEMLGVTKDSFLIAVVGFRLAEEITNEFLEMLEIVLRGNMHVIFWGRFYNFEERVREYPNVRKKSSYLGVCDDILSRMEVSDLYLNPFRKGGGTSCVEAMFQGVPVVTIDYGDVSINAGKEFCVENYQEMQRKILRYYQDSEYYAVMSEKARKQAKRRLDTKTEFLKIMKEAELREQGKKKKEHTACGNRNN